MPDERTSGPDGRRVFAHGKFLWLGDEKFYVRGVTYGTFAPNEDGDQYPPQATVEDDFAQMVANGINAVRTYTVPPLWLLDLAHAHGLRVMVGLSWEDHVAFLDSRTSRRSILRRVREGASACAGHPAVLCYAIGNEIPAQITRWHGRRRIERFLELLHNAVKEIDPAGLVTYVNYPSTEYLELPFLDFVSFNVYLESEEHLAAYLARLHNLAGDRPLVLAEIGLDSRRHGQAKQAETLRWQVETSFRTGSAGCFLFAWTDEWHRGGFEIEDWDFGLTDRRRAPKPALTALRETFDRLPIPEAAAAPRVSVVVCCHNEGATIGSCLRALERLVYPDYEVIVVDDGSTDDTAAVASEFDVRLVSTENRGLAAARNLGLDLATGELVAYIDGDAWPDPHWLTYLTASFAESEHAGIGGPNLPPPDAGNIAACVANAPGGPAHVLVSDLEAEHVPGCNLAFRREALREIGGFDPQFRAAGDDVDVCWRLQESGRTLGFSPAAVVWHHRRSSIRAYWRQQVGYGKAEALLERKWPEKYNAGGHVTWAGRLYGGLGHVLYGSRWRIYYGWGGTGLFQWAHRPTRLLRAVPLAPEWYLLIALLAEIGSLGLLWRPLLLAFPLLALAVIAPVALAVQGGRCAAFPGHRGSARIGLRALTAALFLAQPLARLWGRLRHGLTPWRSRNAFGFAAPLPRTISVWSEGWRSVEDRLGEIEKRLLAAGVPCRRASDFDRWDLEVRGGPLGSARMRVAVEEHGGGKQLVRAFRWPRWSRTALLMLLLSSSIVGVAGWRDDVWPAALVLGATALCIGARALYEAAISSAALANALQRGELAQSPGEPEWAPVHPLLPLEEDLAVTLAERAEAASVRVLERSQRGS